jgi:hypothetical protein
MHPMDDCGPALAALQAGMPELTRSPSPTPPMNAGTFFCDEVCLGTIALRSGNPTDTSG